MKKAIATVARTNEILKKYGLHAKKGYGQNFIIEPGIVEKIASLSGCEGNCVLEIGPGIGALTEQLCKLATKVVAYEIDDNLLDVLKETLEDYDNIEIRHSDFLKVDFDEVIRELRKEYKEIVVCANLPYYITTPILFKIFESDCEVDCITVMVQREVADRFCAKTSTKDYNALSVITQYLYDVKIVMKIPKTIFNPKPNVDSAVIQFKNKPNQIKVDNEQAFFEFVKACFKQRRKTIYNNLRDYVKDGVQVKHILSEANVVENARAEELSLERFIELYNVYRGSI